MSFKTSGMQDILKGVLKYQSKLKKEIFKDVKSESPSASYF